MVKYKIIFTAMIVTLLPIVGVGMVLLLVFLDPVAMLTFIKSSSTLAISIRLFTLMLEILLLINLYISYKKKETIKGIASGNKTTSCEIIGMTSHRTFVEDLFENYSYEDQYIMVKRGESEDIIVLKRNYNELD